MPVSFVRSHGSATLNTAGTQISISLAAAVPANNALVLVWSYDNVTVNGVDGIGITRPSVELTRDWLVMDAAVATGQSAGAIAQTRVRTIMPSVEWPSGSTITCSIGTGSAKMTLILLEFSGVLVNFNHTLAPNEFLYGNNKVQAAAPFTVSTTGTHPSTGALVIAAAPRTFSEGRIRTLRPPDRRLRRAIAHLAAGGVTGCVAPTSAVRFRPRS